MENLSFEYEFVAGFRRNSKLLLLTNEKQLFKIKSLNNKCSRYVCYIKDCKVSVNVTEDGVCTQLSLEYHHNHDPPEDLIQQLKSLNNMKRECESFKRKDSDKFEMNEMKVEYYSENEETFADPLQGDEDHVMSEIFKEEEDTQTSTATQNENHAKKVVDKTILHGVNKLLFNGTFFSIIERLSNTSYHREKVGIIAICQVCLKHIKGSLGVSSNFINHLKKHPNKMLEFESQKKECRKKTERKSTFDRDILDFICETCTPLSILESASFLKLFPGKNVPSTRSIISLLSESYFKNVDGLANKLSNVEYVCTTADVWSSGRKSFLGYTCHWIDSETLQRQSTALACRRFGGSHTFDGITELICEINDQYRLPVGKIVYAITDNAANFVVEFEDLGVSFSNNTSDADSDSEPEFDNSVEPVVLSVTPRLFKHFSCASHTLSVLATVDFIAILNSSSAELKEIHYACFSRCSQIWEKCSRRMSAEIIYSVLSTNLSTPRVTSWNSLYDSLKTLWQHKSNLKELCNCLGISTFSSTEIEYLGEYVKLMKPIAEGIEFLQCEQNSFFGYFIPALVSIKVKMCRLESENFKHLTHASKDMRIALLQRFKKYFLLEPDAWDAVIAAIVIPNVKLKFFKTLLETATTHTVDEARAKLNEYAQEFKLDQPKERNVTHSKSEPSFLDFDENSMDKTDSLNGTGQMLLETAAYLADEDQSMESLNKHLLIKKIFIKYNSPLVSSMPVKRLFSCAEIADRSRRQKLSNKNFEMLVLKKANKF